MRALAVPAVEKVEAALVANAEPESRLVVGVWDCRGFPDVFPERLSNYSSAGWVRVKIDQKIGATYLGLFFGDQPFDDDIINRCARVIALCENWSPTRIVVRLS